MKSDTRSFRSRVLAREPLLGSFINLGSALAAEIAGHAGFDWLLLDHEHGPGGEETLLHQLWACGAAGVPACVRVAWNDPVRLKRALDLGPAAVMIPMVNSAAEAQAAVRAVRFPPRGNRGIAKISRSTGFGAHFDKLYYGDDDACALIVQIETPEAVADVAAIAAVDGVDALFVGPVDLTANLGCLGNQDHPDFVAARQAVAAAARRHGKAAGILQLDASRTTLHRDEGFSLITIGADAGVLFHGLRSIVAEAGPLMREERRP